MAGSDSPSSGSQSVVATCSTYLEAQRTVDLLADARFPVENLRIIGTDLRLVETVTGRLTWLRAAFGAAVAGIWVGLFVALFLGLFAPTGAAWTRLFLAGVAYGGLFGLVFGVVAFAVNGGRRDFTSTSQVVALTYEVTCTTEHAAEAAALLPRV